MGKYFIAQTWLKTVETPTTRLWDAICWIRNPVPDSACHYELREWARSDPGKIFCCAEDDILSLGDGFYFPVDLLRDCSLLLLSVGVKATPQQSLSWNHFLLNLSKCGILWMSLLLRVCRYFS